MPIFPDYDHFAAAYEKGEAQIVSTRLVADLETPVSAMLKLTRNAKYSFLLESVEGGAVRGRYSIIGMNPDMIWKVAGSEASINRKAACTCTDSTRRPGSNSAGLMPSSVGNKSSAGVAGVARCRGSSGSMT